MEKKTMKNTDKRISHETDSWVFDPYAVWIIISAVLQYDGHHYCWKIPGCAGAGSSWFYRLDQFYDYWFLYGSLQWVCHSGSSEIWREKRNGLSSVCSQWWLAGGHLSLVMTVIVCLLCRPILVLMQTPEDIIDGAYAYIFVIFLGIPATYLYNLLACVIRSLGDSKTPLFFLMISSFMNIVLDLFTILVLDMGVAGAAWATVISQAVSGILCLIYIKKKFMILKMEREDWKPDKYAMRVLCGMGIPMGFHYSITAIGSVILQTAVNSLGSLAVASVTAGSKISMFFCCPYDAMGATMATYGGQNVGAKKLDRIDQGIKNCTLLGLGYAVIVASGDLLFQRCGGTAVCRCPKRRKFWQIRDSFCLLMWHFSSRWRW